MSPAFRRVRNRLAAESYCVPGHVHFTLCTFERRPLFRNQRTADEARRSLCDSFDGTGRLDAYCFMPDHLHVLLATRGEIDIRVPLARFKHLSAQAYRARTGNRLWQRGFHDHLLRPDEDVLRTIIYILDNPVRRGLCDDGREWTYSWSRWSVDG